LEQRIYKPPCQNDNFSYTGVRRVIYTGAEGARKTIIRTGLILRCSLPRTRNTSVFCWWYDTHICESRI
jgi:hypothetical protein